MPQVEGLRARFEAALEALLAQVRQDPYILAVVLCGSLAHDTVWDKSDIDLVLVTQEVRPKAEGLSLVEDGVPIHASLLTRGAFRKMLQAAIQSSFLHSLLSQGRMVYARDESLAEAFEQARGRLGAADRRIRLLEQGAGVLPGLAKAEKWLRVRGDVHYAFFWLMKIVDGLAGIEVLLAGEVTAREVVQQALRLNSPFFRAIYSDLIDGPKTPETVGAALQGVADYLRARTDLLFGPILEYLRAEEGVRSVTEINDHFQREMGMDGGVDAACEWLAAEGIIAQVGAPLRLTEKSRVDVQEAAYHYAGAPA